MILVPLTHLLVDRQGIEESFRLHVREGFDATSSFDRISGANWVVFETELLIALQTRHADIMAARGGLAWALWKPLYPFKIGEFHCPRVSPRLSIDLRLNSPRTLETLSRAGGPSFASREFSYENWIKSSGWEEVFASFGPLKIDVEPTNECGATCVHCPNPGLKRPRGKMSLETFQKLRAGVMTVDDARWVFSGIGEPLLNPFLPDMLRQTADRHSMLVTSLHPGIQKGFPFDALDQLRISVDALEQSFFDRIRTGCSWPMIETFIKEFAPLKAKAPNSLPEVGVTMVKHRTSGKFGLDFLHYWKKVCTPVFKQHFFRWPPSMPQEMVQWYQVLGASDFLGSIRNPVEVPYTPLKRRPCRHALVGMHVLWDGRLALCPFDTEGAWSAGSLSTASPLDLWRSTDAAGLRKAHLEMRYPENLPCGNCQDWYHRI